MVAERGPDFHFPPKDPTVLSAAMVDTQTAPEWIDSDVCLRCRDAFTFTNRKHHCRNCGQVFDQKCSSRSLPLPHFGITDPVRVCDNCHPKLLKNANQQKSHTHHGRSYSQGAHRHRQQRDFEDAELQRAIQLSLQEMGSSHTNRPGYVSEQPSNWYASEPPLVDRKSRPVADDEDDPDLKAAIEASLRDANAPRASAPVAVETPRWEQQQPYFSYAGPGYSQSYPPASTSTPQPSVPALPNYDLAPLESDVILAFNQAVEHVQAQGSQDIRRYPAANELHQKATTLTPKLTMSMDDTGRKHGK
jgi:hepatocyte growth factor-regulated tyrosine kinase substrate